MSVELPNSRADFDDPHLRAVVANLTVAREHQRLWAKRADQYEEELRKAVGEHTEGYLDGEHRFSYRRTGPFASKRFTQDHPELARKFSLPKVVEELDTEALAYAEPELYLKYKARRFLLTKEVGGGQRP